ncbi:MAG: hypothetical protein NC081_01045 [Roseburia sp.]|nr:hypothetical protein [Roseburia sp.]
MVGSFATSKAGHDKQKLYVVLREEGEYVLLCDGRIRTLAKPKKKKKKHIQIINRKVNEELLHKLEQGQDGAQWAQEKIFDEEIKYEIRQYSKQVEL